MRTLSFSASILIFTVIFHSCLHHNAAKDEPLVGTNRKALEVIIGGGDEVPAPLPENEDCLPPKVWTAVGCFENKRLAKAYVVIHEFKKRLQIDVNSLKYTRTWYGTNVCRYKGFRCGTRPDVKQKAVSAVDFNGAKFAGCNGSLPLDGFIDELDDLAIFHANSNNFTGTIPSGVSKIKYLYEVDLSNNQLHGDFPMDVLGAMNLTFLDLRYNSIRGVLPPQLFRLTLDVLFINDNNFAQSQLPGNLGDTPVLYLTFAGNRFTGGIPPSFGKAANLLEVLFLNNQLSGCLPYEIGNLNKSTVLDVGSNNLTGPIPYSFGCLKRVEVINLANNKFYGEVPEIVCELPKLENFTLRNNYFTYVGPACRDLIWKKKLDVRNNCIFDLPYQRSEAECKAFLSKKPQCQRIESFYWVPCKDGFDSNSEKSAQEPTASAPSGRTHDTLTPRHRL